MTYDDIESTELPADIRKVKDKLTAALMEAGIAVDYRTVIDSSHDPDVMEKIVDRHFDASVDSCGTAKAFPFGSSKSKKYVYIIQGIRETQS